MKTKLFGLASWAVFLVSAALEIDFPLTPALWLVIAACFLLVPFAHAAVGRRKWETGTNRSLAAPLLSDSTHSIGTGNKSSQVSNRYRNIHQDNFGVSSGYFGQMDSGGVINTTIENIPALIFLSLAVTRGPPEGANEIDRTPGYPASHFYAVPLSSEFRFHDSTFVRSTFLNRTRREPICSAIEGDPT